MNYINGTLLKKFLSVFPRRLRRLGEGFLRGQIFKVSVGNIKNLPP